MPDAAVSPLLMLVFRVQTAKNQTFGSLRVSARALQSQSKISGCRCANALTSSYALPDLPADNL